VEIKGNIIQVLSISIISWRTHELYQANLIFCASPHKGRGPFDSDCDSVSVSDSDSDSPTHYPVHSLRLSARQPGNRMQTCQTDRHLFPVSGVLDSRLYIPIPSPCHRGDTSSEALEHRSPVTTPLATHCDTYVFLLVTPLPLAMDDY